MEDITLNEAQEQAAGHVLGPLLVLAGAGSGKTRVLISRIQRLVQKEGVGADRILAITFTRKAAGEMRERISIALGKSAARSITVSTFHALGAEMLKQYGYVAGFKGQAGISDEVASRARIRHILREMGASLGEKNERPSDVLERITEGRRLLVDKLVRTGATMAVLDRYFEGSGELWRELEEEGGANAARFGAQYSAYSGAQRGDNVVDYEDLINLPALICLSRPEIRRIWTGKWEHVLVDEYQDTDVVQDHLLRFLAGGHNNICAVGDDEQAIYSWRGAKVENIRTFEKRWQGCKVVRMEDNYRSSPEILAVANATLAARAKGRVPRILRTANPPSGRIRVWRSPNQETEAAAIARDIGAKIASGVITELGEVFILYRMNIVAREVELALKRQGIAYRIVNQPSLHERAQARIMVALLKLAINPYDTVSLETAAAGTGGGLGPQSMEILRARARGSGKTPFELLDTAGDLDGLRPAAIRALRRVKSEIQAMISETATAGVAHALRSAVERTGARKCLIDTSSEAEGQEDDEEVLRLERQLRDFDDFLLFAEEFEQRRPDMKHEARAFVEELTTSADTGASEMAGGAIALMSVHAAKGLEARDVYVIALEEGTFPVDTGMSSTKSEQEAEEARLFYVAVTRAKERLVLSSARTREKNGDVRPAVTSRYLSDLPETEYSLEIKHPDGLEPPV